MTTTPNTWTVTDPSGKTWTKAKGKRVYTHALIRRNIGSETYFVNWASSEANAKREARVFADQRDYVEIVAL